MFITSGIVDIILNSYVNPVKRFLLDIRKYITVDYKDLKNSNNLLYMYQSMCSVTKIIPSTKTTILDYKNISFIYGLFTLSCQINKVSNSNM